MDGAVWVKWFMDRDGMPAINTGTVIVKTALVTFRTQAVRTRNTAFRTRKTAFRTRNTAFRTHQIPLDILAISHGIRRFVAYMVCPSLYVMLSALGAYSRININI